MKKVSFSFFLVSLLILAGCGGTDSSSADTSGSQIKLLSPADKSSVAYNYVTLEVDDTVADVKAAVNGTEYVGVKNSDSFFIYNVLLQSGENTITLSTGDGSEKLNVTVSSEDNGFPPVNLSADQSEGYEKLDVTLSVDTALSVSRYMLDQNSDGVIDERKNSNGFSVSYTNEGRFFPMATIEVDGVLYSTQKDFSLDVKAKPTVEALSALAAIDTMDMQIFDYERYYILSADNSVYEINATSNQILNTIAVANANGAEGFFVDGEGNIFIANTGADQVLKLSKANNYGQTMAFGSSGSENGAFDQPKDIVVEGSGEEQKIYVLDSGNNRVQVFNYVGAYLYAFDGSTTPTGKLDNPTSMVGYFAQPLTIVDSGNGVIRTLQCSMNQPEHEVSVIQEGLSSNLGKITLGSDLIVPDKANKKILFFQNGYWLNKSIDVDKTPEIAISQDGLAVVVASEGVSGVETVQVQIDPKGAEPMDVAKAFVQALIDGDRAMVEELVAYDQNRINLIYGNQENLNQSIALYKQISTWSQTYHTSGYATVKAHIQTATDAFDATFELNIANTQIKASRVWVVTKFY